MADTAAPWTIPDPVIPIDHPAALAAVRRVAGEVVELIRGTHDVEAPVPEADWTFREAACHLITVFRVFGAPIEGRLDA